MADVTVGKQPASDPFDEAANDAPDKAGDSEFDTDGGLAAWLTEHPDVLAELKRRIARPVSECLSEEEMLAAINYIRHT